MNVDGRFSIKVWTYVENLGDGSCAVRFFSTREAAEEFAAEDDERFCDDINLETLEFDEGPSGKILLNPDKRNHSGN